MKTRPARMPSGASALLVAAMGAFAAVATAQAQPAQAPPDPTQAAQAQLAALSTGAVTHEADRARLQCAPGQRIALEDLPAPREFVTRHRMTIGGREIAYTATAGETYITDVARQPIASVFSFSYIKDGPADPRRPVMFVFNGGPGSSSIWLHMGILGPKRIVLDQEVNPSNTPPFGLRDNPYSPLDVADLVFVDPVATGYSRAIGHACNTDFFSVDADADAAARFIEAWITRHGRWNSPKYLVGESYGALRVAVLPRALMGGPLYMGVMRGITVDGVMLVGASLNIGVKPDPGAAPPSGPDRAVGLRLPSFAATAWYHGKIDRAGRSVEQVYDEVKAFAKGEYAEAMHRLDNGGLPEAEKARIAGKLAAYTGLPAETWLQADLRVMGAQPFLRRIVADRGLEAGVYDSRYTLPLAHSGNDPVADDPAMGQYVPGFVAAFHDMLRNDLEVSMPGPYGAIVWEGLVTRWSFDRAGMPPGSSFAADLAVAMRRTPRLRVMAASGYYDLGPTPAGIEHQLTAAGLPADRVTYRNYESGHMLYLGGTAEAFANDVRQWILAAQ